MPEQKNQVSIYAKDYAGNRSDVVKLDNPYYKEPAPENETCYDSTPESVRYTDKIRLRKKNPSGSNAATLPAAEILPVQITVPDSRKILLRSRKVHLPRKAPERYRTTSAVRMGKNQFYTITTDAGNVFYLVIDGKREDNNVYFLNGVTESDLMALAEKNNGSMSMIPQGRKL